MVTRRSSIAAGLVALCAAIAPQVAQAGPVSVGHSGWQWGDPVPQGETLNSVAFQGARGYAVGERGTVLRSDDGGSTWIGLASGTGNGLGLVQEIDPATVVVGGGCTVRESTDAGASFHRMPVNESEEACATKIASLSFLSANTGYIEEADGSILLTKDGGQTLEQKTKVPLNGAGAGPIVFTSPTVGFAVASGSGGGRIYRTTDGAGSWTQVASAVTGLSGLTFVSATTAYAVGSTGTLLRTADGGSTWEQLTLTVPGPRPSLTQISCSDVEHCLIATAPVAGGSNVLVRTTDGGKTGTLVSPAEQNLLSVAFSTASNAVAVGQGGVTVLSSDGGATFPMTISRRLGGVFDTVIRTGASAQDAYIPGQAGLIAATTNGGASWGLLRVPTSALLRDVAFPGTELGYAVSTAGTLYRTNTAGLSWSILKSGGGAPRALLAPDANIVLLIGPLGVRRSTNGGARFTTVKGTIVTGKRGHRVLRTRLSRLNLSGGAQLAGSAVVAFGTDIVASSDGGAHWKLIPRPLPRRPVTAISFVSATTGYAVSGGRLFFTANRGRSWREILSLGGPAVGRETNLSFSSALDGYALIPYDGSLGNIVMRTSDGGRTWTPEALPLVINTLTAGGAVDYAAAEGALFQTTDGGLHESPSTLTLAISGSHRLSRAKLRRAGGRVRLVGHLSPAQGGEDVTISYRTVGGGWRRRDVIATSSGAFSLTVGSVRGTTDFVAQWTGSGPISGAGTPAVRLTVTRR